jgi:hypothetical protein
MVGWLDKGVNKMAKNKMQIVGGQNENSVEANASVSNFKCEEALVAFIVREVNEKGQTVSEKTAEPVKMFRASDGANIWAVVDNFIEKATRQ